MSVWRLLIAALALGCVVLAGCSSSGSGRRTGGYYQNDGPGSGPMPDIDSIPDAVPRIEAYSSGTSKPYVVFGKRYVPIVDGRPFRQAGVASWYGRQFHGNKTANGETYDMYAMTAAHPTLPIPSYARVTRANTGKSIIVRINDRGPFHSSRIIDLSYVAAAKLGIIGPGSGQVIVEGITHADIARGVGTRTASAASPAAGAAARSTPAIATAAIRAAPAKPATPEGGAGRGEPAGVPSAQTETVALASPSIEPLDLAPAAAPTPDALSALTGGEEDDAAPPAPLLSSPSPASSPSPIYLQFGAFSAPENAESLAQRLNQQLAQSEARPVRVQNAGDLYKVRMGPYASRGEAVNAAWRVQQQTGAQPGLAAH